METTMQEFDNLSRENQRIANEIAVADKNKDTNLSILLKKELYANKLTMLDIISQNDKRAGITALEYMKMVEDMPTVPKYATGVDEIDGMYAFNGGFETGMFIQLAGVSGGGKTTLILRILTNIAQGNRAVFFNFEMGKKLLYKKLKNLNINTTQQKNLIIDDQSRKLDDLIMEIELYSKEGVKFFAIDSKMKIEIAGNDDEHIKISKLSKELAKLSQKRDIIIILINQMSESDLKNGRLAFKGSGDQQYDSDVSLFIVVGNDGKRSLICNKNRQEERLFEVDLKEHNQYSAQPTEVTTYQPDININVDMPDLF